MIILHMIMKMMMTKSWEMDYYQKAKQNNEQKEKIKINQELKVSHSAKRIRIRTRRKKLYSSWGAKEIHSIEPSIKIQQKMFTQTRVTSKLFTYCVNDHGTALNNGTRHTTITAEYLHKHSNPKSTCYWQPT